MHIAAILVTFGGIFLVGLLADLVGRFTPLPRVTLLLVSGFVFGPAGLGWLPAFTASWFPLLTDTALAMIGFLLGQRMTRADLGGLGREVIAMSLGVVTASIVLVFGVLYAFGVPPIVAVLLAGIAPATAPAATLDVIRESRAAGRFTTALLGIVAIDDAWGLLVFSLALAAAHGLDGHGGALAVIGAGVWEIGGALALGVALGMPMAYLTGRLNPGEPTQAEALGFVLLCAGLAVWLHVSYILAGVTMGAVVANVARHHERPFHAIEGIEWPFLILFFLLAGATLRFDALGHVAPLVAGYIVLRAAARFAGVSIGGRIGRADRTARRWMGFALMPQAGVAIGLALLAVQRFPHHQDVILPVILGSTVFFDIVGPVSTRYVLRRVGEATQP